jgi:hypothetical protein
MSTSLLQEAPRGGAPAPEEISEGLSALWEDGSDRLLICFSGFHTRERPWSLFHFMGLMKKFPVNQLFFRDPHLAWYHKGIPGISGSIDETAAYIGSVIAERKIKKTMALGVSSGGYAALIHGWLLELDEVHAVVPQTYVDVDNRLIDNDFRMDDNTPNLYDGYPVQTEYFELAPLFRRAPNLRTKINVHYCSNHRLDAAHALRMEGVPGVTLHAYEEGGHRLTPRLTRDGTIDRWVENALGVKADPKRMPVGRGGAGAEAF